MTVRRREAEMDFIKGVAIILVIWGHTLQYLAPDKYSELLAHRVIYSFHMPLFMMVSGYFAARFDKLDDSYKFIKNKFIQLIIPVIAGCILVIGTSIIISTYFIGLGVFYTHYWFLKSLFICFLIELVTYKITKRLKFNIIVFILLGLLICQFISIWNVNLMYPAFTCGILMSLFDKQIAPYYMQIACIGAILFVTLFLSSFHVDVHTNQIIKVTMGIAAASSIIAGCKAIGKYRPTIFDNVISKIGQETLGIYILQTIVLEMVIAHYYPRHNISSALFSYIVAPFITLFVTAICWQAVILISRNSHLKFWIFGKR